MRRGRPGAVPAVLLLVSIAILGLSTLVLGGLSPAPEPPSFTEQLCSLPKQWLLRTRRGHFGPRSGQITLLPRTPAYMASGGSGWSHSGPWPYLQEVPLVLFGPGLVPPAGTVERPVTMADIAPTLAALMGRDEALGRVDGRVLSEAVTEKAAPPKLILVIVWDGGGWNTLRRWPDAWPHLEELMAAGLSYSNATVGSSPSVTPSVHTTLGTGIYPDRSGITGIPVRYEDGHVGDVFVHGASSRFLRVPALAELWDERHGNRPLIGMLGYEPWHLGMIGKGAERAGGDKDDALWLDVETNEWITNPDHYRLPEAVVTTPGLDADLERLDRADGAADGAWGSIAAFDDPDRVEETPAFVAYHGRALRRLIVREGYGDDSLTDLLFTNFKQIDRLGHYFNMASDEVRQALVASDVELGKTVEFLERRLGRSNFLLVLTADHGQQPDASDIDAYGIDPGEVERDLDEAFGPVTQAVWPTEVFLDDDELRARDVSVAAVARWLGSYELRDNTRRPDMLVSGAGEFEPGDRLFKVAAPARLLERPGLCGYRAP
ncbi:MAG TPA: alkaline phosphatase family protein [Actinomycetota bacterium]|nr:alkaline phosphatase family protein [Actinomycetota bacterium]